MVKALKKCHIGKKNAYQLYKGSKSFEKKVKVWEKNTRSHHAKAKAHLGKMVKALKKCHIGKKNAYQLYKGSKHFEKMVKVLKKCHIGKKNAYKVYKLAKHDEKKFKKGVIRRKIIRSKKAPLCTSTVILVG